MTWKRKVLIGLIASLLCAAPWAYAQWQGTQGQSITAVPSGTQTIEGTVLLNDTNLDTRTDALNITDYGHHEIHAGSAYFAVRSELGDTSDDVEVRIATPDTTKWAHMVITIDCALACTAELWNPTTMTHVVGNVITPMNRDHNSSNTSGLTVCHTPGGSQAGTANLLQYIGAATTNGRIVNGGGTGNRTEFILDQNSSYLIRVTSRADSNAMSIILDWYEHTNH